jgi:RNA polymerase sigma-70 factor (ECF subfamily)
LRLKGKAGYNNCCISKIIHQKSGIMRTNRINFQTMKCMEVEKGLILNAKNNPEKFDLLYRQYHDQIFRYVYRNMGDKEMAFDVTSQVFFKALTHLEKYEFKGVPFSAWLFRIAKSELYQSFRDKKNLSTVDISNYQLIESQEDTDHEENEFIRKKLIRCLAKLRMNDLVLIELRFFENKSFREIGNRLGITENNAKVKTFRAIDRLKRFM